MLVYHAIFYKRVWKDLTLSSDADRAKYKVWDYPIKEKYSHMLETMEKNEMVKTREDGYQRVLDTLDGTFAFIDESARVTQHSSLYLQYRIIYKPIRLRQSCIHMEILLYILGAI